MYTRGACYQKSIVLPDIHQRWQALLVGPGRPASHDCSVYLVCQLDRHLPLGCVRVLNDSFDETVNDDADGIEATGGRIEFKANVRQILTEGTGQDVRAVGVKLQDGRVYRGKVSTLAGVYGFA